MPSFIKPFAAVTGRHSYSLFDVRYVYLISRCNLFDHMGTVLAFLAWFSSCSATIFFQPTDFGSNFRLDDDFIVFRGNEQESSGQLLKGVVVLCLSSPLRMEDVHLRLIGTLRLQYASPINHSPYHTPGVTGQRVDRTISILDHRWPAFVGTHGKSMTLPAGNYEYPFEYTLPGDTAESVEGIPEASITYRLKATVSRGKFAYDLHAYKHLRIIRTLEPGALEFLHAMSVENIWPNKIEYSIVIPQKAVVFGGTINMEMRFSPLLKGLELGDITAKMVEIRDCFIQGATGLNMREHRVERDVATWKFSVDREEHWHDMIEDSGQEGWLLNKPLSLPKKLRQCIQDLNHHGIRVRHKIKLTVALRNPDGHISELRATLPVSIFISPNIPFDEQGNLVSQAPGGAALEQDLGSIAPPGYGEHVLDQLYDEVDVSGFQTPAVHSGFNSPFYGHSRTGSSENLAAFANGAAAITPAALSSRLADVSLDPSQRNSSYQSVQNASGRASPTHGSNHTPHTPHTPAHLSRTNSEEEESSARSSAERAQVDVAEFAELNRVPSYSTAVKTPARSRTQTSAFSPDYQTALSAPRTPPNVELGSGSDPLSTITEHTVSETHMQSVARALSPPMARSQSDDTSGHRRLHLFRGRDQAV
ncbi:hect-type ubiquitin ligase-interacting cred [Trichoderma arundinaceum]|uniref:Hect-type ubiquitin ligase-interacting cred n=1 Tax=Trichoderma arundinaceum TaxID=490622 RepID=A0A395NR78_TRIAR|nr:hect-type ubiquitin ligase-interacting cred [Trichoderma arundinaceum]